MGRTNKKIFENSLQKYFAKDFFASIPQLPGVYFMKCAQGEVLYIGKATVLRARIRSYRNAKPGKVGKNILKLLEHVRSIEWEVHTSEVDAFGRELELIRAFIPPYNIADAWEEDYFYIGLRCRNGQLDFRLTRNQADDNNYRLHGCYPRRIHVKQGYAALLRLLFACTYRGQRFAYPARIARPSPAYEYTFKIEDAAQWSQVVSDFLHGRRSRFLQLMVERLLANPCIPEYVRTGLQRDIGALGVFEKLCLHLAKTRNKVTKHVINHNQMRQELQQSILK